MSLTSKSRKESSESNAAQRMGNTMGQHPETGQLYDRDLRADLTSKRADSSDYDRQDVQPIDAEPNAEQDNRVEAVRRDTVEDTEMSRVREQDSDFTGERYMDQQANNRGLSNAPLDDEMSYKHRNPDGPVDELGHS